MHWDKVAPILGATLTTDKAKKYIGKKIVKIVMFLLRIMKLYLIDIEYKISARLSGHEMIDVNTPNLNQSNLTLRYRYRLLSK